MAELTMNESGFRRRSRAIGLALAIFIGVVSVLLMLWVPAFIVSVILIAWKLRRWPFWQTLIGFLTMLLSIVALLAGLLIINGELVPWGIVAILLLAVLGVFWRHVVVELRLPRAKTTSSIVFGALAGVIIFSGSLATYCAIAGSCFD